MGQLNIPLFFQNTFVLIVDFCPLVKSINCFLLFTCRSLYNFFLFFCLFSDSIITFWNFRVSSSCETDSILIFTLLFFRLIKKSFLRYVSRRFWFTCFHFFNHFFNCSVQIFETPCFDLIFINFCRCTGI